MDNKSIFDPSITLALSIQKNPGIYALLLGAGISQSVGIPTGWDITQDILQQIKIIGVTEPPEDVGYDELLRYVGQTQSERSIFLKSYFEPSETEQEQGIKLPSLAHRAIAELIKDGFIKVVLTTNFDRLLEIALTDIGITPDVIRSDDMLKGASPIRHNRITIVQLHGDYRDARTLNTAKELEIYTQEKNKFLDDIFDEYGLIICGWSAKWDKALRDAILRITPRWYATYWIEPYPISNEAKEIIRHRKAEVIQIKADDFFVSLQNKVTTLTKLWRKHPLSVAVAVEQVKKLLPKQGAMIELADLLNGEAEEAYQRFANLEYNNSSSNPQEINQFYVSCLSDYMEMVETVLKMVTTVCWHGIEGQQANTITTIMNRWSTPANSVLEDDLMSKIPPLLLLYVGGMAAVYRANWGYLRILIYDSKAASFKTNKRLPILSRIKKNKIFNYRVYSQPSIDNYDPISELLRLTLRPIFQAYLPTDRDFRELFNLFEMLLALISLNDQTGWIDHDAAARDYGWDYGWDHIVDFWDFGAKQGGRWDFLQMFFQGDKEQLVQVLEKYRAEAIKSQAFSMENNNIPNYREVYEKSFVGV